MDITVYIVCGIVAAYCAWRYFTLGVEIDEERHGWRRHRRDRD